MRSAHFSNEIVILPVKPMDTSKMAVSMHSNDVEENVSLRQRIEEFKNDSNNMSVISEFIDQLLQQAETEVNRHNDDIIDPKSNSEQILADLDYSNEVVIIAKKLVFSN